MEKSSHDELLYILSFLLKKREDLISPFLNKDYEWIGMSFKYEKKQVAFNLVRERYITLWIDKHITQIIEEDVPDNIKNKVLKFISEYMYTLHSRIVSPQISHTLLEIKLNTLKILLENEDLNNQKINELRYSYEKDKALFEREFHKYDTELNSNIHLPIKKI